MTELPRVVITGIGLTSPNGNSLQEYRANLLAGVSGVSPYEIRHVGETLAGVCDFDALKHQKKKEVRRGTRAGSIAIYCANDAASCITGPLICSASRTRSCARPGIWSKAMRSSG